MRLPCCVCAEHFVKDEWPDASVRHASYASAFRSMQRGRLMSGRRPAGALEKLGPGVEAGKRVASIASKNDEAQR